MRGRKAAESFLTTCAAAFPEGAFARVRAVGPVAFFPGIDIYPDRIAGEGIVLVGDAAGANDPSQGQGISLAFRDVRELRDLLLDNADWAAALARFAARRRAYFEVLRTHAQWAGRLATETGPDADALRDQVARAREIDPTAGGFAALYALGPDGLVADEAARRHFFGEDLPAAAD